MMQFLPVKKLGCIGEFVVMKFLMNKYLLYLWYYMNGHLFVEALAMVIIILSCSGDGLKRKQLSSDEYRPSPTSKKKCQQDLTSDPSSLSGSSGNILADILTDIPELDINPITLSDAK